MTCWPTCPTGVHAGGSGHEEAHREAGAGTASSISVPLETKRKIKQKLHLASSC